MHTKGTHTAESSTEIRALVKKLEQTGPTGVFYTLELIRLTPSGKPGKHEIVKVRFADPDKGDPVVPLQKGGMIVRLITDKKERLDLMVSSEDRVQPHVLVAREF